MTRAVLHRRGSLSFLSGLREPERDALVKRYSYFVEGAEFSPLFRDKKWDGYRRLVRPRGDTSVLLPAGLEPEIVTWLRTKRLYDVDLVSELPTWPPAARWGWAGPRLRVYQNDAVTHVLEAGGGIIRLPIRAGKTLTAAELIRQVGRRALFVVTSEMLLRQAYEVFSRVLVGPTIGICGAGERVDGDVVVATVQTLTAMSKEDLKAFQRSYALVIADECHHASSDGGGTAWRDVLLGMVADMRVGLSATVPDLVAGQPAESHWIWLRAICGGVVTSLTVDDLVEQGFLLRPHISWLHYDGDGMKVEDARQLPTTLAGWKARNEAIVACTAERAAAGQRVLVDCSRVGHSRQFVSLLKADLGAKKVGLLLGASPTTVRKAVLDAFVEGQLRVIVGTVLGEGLDIPPLEVVINAEGGCGDIPLMQRMRCLTLCKGKTKADMVDVWDNGCPEALGWSQDRLNFYRRHPSFVVEAPEEP